MFNVIFSLGDIMISVIFNNGEFDVVSAETLEELINSRRIKKFKRSSGWAVIGVDLVRGMSPVVYCGEERRSCNSKGS